MVSVAIVHSLYAPDIIGGAEISTQLLAETIGTVAKVIVITVGGHSDGVKKESINNVTVYRLPYNNVFWYGDRKSHKNILQKITWRLRDVFNRKQYKLIKKILLEEKCNILHSQNLPGISLSVWKLAHDMGIPIVHTLRDYSLIEPINIGLYSKIYRLISKRYSRYVTSIVGISNFVLKRHTDLGFFSNAQKYVVSNVVNDTELLIDTKENNSSALTIGYFGQLSQNKGIDFLINAIEKLPNEVVKQLIICGDGEIKSDLMKQAQNDLRITFLGKVPKDEVSKLMANIDLTIVPSVWDEPFGRVIIESYQVGTPVLASCVGGIPDVIISDEYLFEARNAGQIAGKIKAFASKSFNERQIVREQVREHCKLFDTNSHRENYLKVYAASYPVALASAIAVEKIQVKEL